MHKLNTQDPLFIGSALSIFLLILLLFLHLQFPAALDIPAHWLGIAVLPILVGLFVGGYISSFKGFGIELEAALKTPVSNVRMTAAEAIEELPGQVKRESSFLRRLPLADRKSTRWLRFYLGKRDYYAESVIAEYLEAFPSLDYFEIVSEEGEVVGFLPVSIFTSVPVQSDKCRELLHRFIFALGEGKEALKREFPGKLNDLTVAADARLVEVLKRMRNQNAEFARVLSDEGKYLGVVYAHTVERSIADAVLNSKS